MPTSQDFNTVIKKFATKTMVVLLSSTIALTGLATSAVITIYKCPIGDYVGKNYNLEIFEECIITEGFTKKEIKARLQNLGAITVMQGLNYQDGKLIFPDGKILNLNNPEIANLKVEGFRITDDKIQIAKTGGENIELKDINQAIQNTNLNPNGQPQTLSINGDTLAISNGNFVRLPSSTQNFVTNIQNTINQVSTSSSASSFESNQSSAISQSSESSSSNQAIVIVGGGSAQLIASNSSNSSQIVVNSSTSTSTPSQAFGFNVTTNSSGLPININSNETLNIVAGANLKSTIDNTLKKITLAVVDTPTFTDLTVTGNTYLNGNITIGQLNNTTPASNSSNFLGFDNSGNLVKVTPAVGSQGPQGLQGLTGLTGASGPQGPIGLTGAQGPKGDTGLTGSQGIQGLIGLAGQNGSNGLDGKTVLNGATPPQLSNGIDGDFYIDSLSGIIYGPKTALGWGSGFSLIGSQGIQGVQGLTGSQGIQGIAGVNGLDGKSLLNGVIDPQIIDGIDGDFYINTSTNSIFGPKTSSGWGASVSLIGATGAQGIQGIQGLTGLTGAVGPQGIQGLTGLTGATGAQGIQGIAGIANIQTANNGLTLTGSNLKLGGVLSEPTTLTSNSTNTLAILGLVSGSLSDKLIVQDSTTGVLKKIDTNLFNTNPSLYYKESTIVPNVLPTNTGNQSVVIGSGSTNISDNSFVIGKNSTASGDSPSYIFGENNISNTYEFANYIFGENNSADNASGQTLTIGAGNLNNNNYRQIAVGFGNNVSNSGYGGVFGNNNVTGPSGQGSYSFGYGISNNIAYSVQIGTADYNKLTIGQNGAVTFQGALQPNGNAGTTGQVLVSQGSGAAPIWQPISGISPITVQNGTSLFSTGIPGSPAGLGSTSQKSIFLGQSAGDLTSNADFSFFLGSGAGYQASNASYSTFIGNGAGSNAFNATNSIFVGSNAGQDDGVDNLSTFGSSILIGNDTNTGGFSNSIAIGAGARNTSSNQLTIGDTYDRLRIGGVEYTVPTVQGAAGQMLTNDGSGGLSWANSTGGACTTCFVNGGNTFGGQGYLGTNDNFGLLLGTNGTARLEIASIPSQSGRTVSIFNDALIDGITVGTGGGSGNNTVLGNLAMNNSYLGFNNNNTAVGSQTLYSITDGAYNTAVGSQALQNTEGGYNNTALGAQSLYANTTGSYNIGVGGESFLNLNSGDGNSAFGFNAGRGLNSGYYNTIIGSNSSGYNLGLTIGNYNTLIGANINSLPSNLSNNIILADGQGNRRINVNSSGLVGIGTINPTERLDINGNLKFSGSLLANGISGTAGQILTSQGPGVAPLWTTPTSPACNNSWTGGSGYGTPLCIGGNDGGPANPTIIGLKNNAFSYGLFIQTSKGIRLSLTDGSTTSNQQFYINPDRDYAGNSIAPNNDSGLTLSQLSNATPTSAAVNYLGFDNTGKVVKVASPGPCATCFVNGGNSFAGLATIGTTNAQNLIFLTAGNQVATLSTNGNLGLGVPPSSYRFDIGGVDANNRKIAINGTQVLYSPDSFNNNGSLFLGNGGQNTVALSNGRNTGVGFNALNALTSGNYNTATGYGALESNLNGSNNVAMGLSALGANIQGGQNTAIGFLSMSANISGYNNTATGYRSLDANISGIDNAAFGFRSGYFNTTGNNNTFIGDNAGYSNTTGSENTYIGASTNYGNNGSFNTVIGYNPNNGLSGASGNTIIGRAGYLGSNTNLTNNIILADGAGNRRINVDSNGFVGIGTTSPSSRLEIESGVANTSGLKFTSLTSASPTSTGQAIGVDVNGNLVTIASSGSGWGLSGNAGTTSSNYLGTSDLQPLQFRTNNVDRGRFDTSGNFVINKGTSNPVLGSDFTILNTTGGFATAEIKGGSNGGAAIQKFTNDAGYQFGVGVGGSANNSFANGSFVIRDQNTFQNRLVVGQNGNVGIGDFTSVAPSNKLTVENLTTTSVAKFNGSASTQCTVVTGTGLSCSSDRRLKQNISGLTNATDIINGLRPVTYQWNGGSETQYGFIAQDVQTVLPDLVTTNSDGYLSLSKDEIIPFLVKGLQEANTKIESFNNNAGASAINNFNQVTNFLSDIVVKGTAWIQDLVVKGSTIFQGRVEFQDKDMAGVATLKANSKEIEIRYTIPYNFTPIVNITSLGHRIVGNLKSSNPNGFVIEVENLANADIKFNWVAINAQGEELVSAASSSSSSISSSSSSSTVTSSSSSSVSSLSSSISVSSSSEISSSSESSSSI
jgi:trimeric autotransporter adhesin